MLDNPLPVSSAPNSPKVRVSIWPVTAAIAVLACATPARSDQVTDPIAQLSDLSIDELSQVDVSSVSKSLEPLRTAPAAIFVITREDIERSGLASIPELLRLAPNLHVARTSSSQYVITARGLNGSPEAQNFSNKLLVLVDGRTVYSPLFSGVYWDLQDVFPEDIDRIEVISGPGATLWGANAVNGVINIITRPASATQGGVVSANLGSLDRNVGFRYGGRIGQQLTWRMYARVTDGQQTRTQAGERADDNWHRAQGGVRIDWDASARDAITLQGDLSEGAISQSGPDEKIRGRNILARWTHEWDANANIEVQAYYDRVERGTAGSSIGFTLDTYDLAVQQRFQRGVHSIVVGGGIRFSSYSIDGRSDFFFAPDHRVLTLSNVFIQDSIALGSRLKLIVGGKVEDDPLSGIAFLPSVRLAFTPSTELLLWGSVSRAVRSPTPFDTDVVEKIGDTVFLVGNPAFRPEALWAYQAGARWQIGSAATLSVSAFFNDYAQLRNIEIAPDGFLPLRWGNGLEANTYGVETWGDYVLAKGWRLSASFVWFGKDARFVTGATPLLGTQQLGNDPAFRATLGTSIELADTLSVNADLRYVGVLPEPRVAPYAELNIRCAWQAADRLRLSVIGANLINERHVEFTGGNAIPRSVSVEARWQF